MLTRSRYIDLVRRAALSHGKMAFITGPRQVGKTTLARQLLPADTEGIYYTWDDVEFRRAWIRDPKTLVPRPVGRRPMVVFDELHKAPRWKTRLKGVYELRHDEADIIVTGSARLDLFRRGGDSLLGRYFLFRLHPLSVGEVEGAEPATPDTLPDRLRSASSGGDSPLERLLGSGGFPEPFFKNEPAFARIWRRSRTERLVRDDLLDMTRVHEPSLLESAASLIPERVGSLFSVQSLARDLEVSHATAQRWLTWFSHLFLVFIVPPYTRSIARSIRKQPKVYLWDWSEVPDPGARLENLVAGHLLKAAHFWTDGGLGTFELFTVRDKDKREVDFLVTRDRRPWLMVECTLGEKGVSRHLRSFAAAIRPSLSIQLAGTPGVHEWFDLGQREKGMIVSADRFLRLLP